MALKIILLNTALAAVYCLNASKYEKEGATAILKCPFLSVIGWSNVGSTTIYATRNTTISDRYEINKTSLIIRRLITTDVGIYRCTSLNEKPVWYDIMLYIKSVPRVVDGKTIFNISTIIGRVLNISIEVNCFPKPIASWSHSSGAKTGMWNVDMKLGHSSSYTLTSSVLCLHKSHLGLYKVNVRNTEGSVEISIYLIERDKIRLAIDPTNAVCITSHNIKISCFHGNKEQLNAVFKWYHYHNGIPIRELNGNAINNRSVLSLKFCDYQDVGQYVCSVTKYNQTKTVSSQLIVYGAPMITGKMTSTNDTSIKMIVSFFSNPDFQSFVWYKNDIRITSNDSISITESNVSVLCYGTRVLKQGYQIYMLLNKYTNAFEDINSLTVDIKNVMGSSMASFDHEVLVDVIQSTEEKVINALSTEENIGPYSTAHEYMYVNVLRTTKHRTLSSDDIEPSSETDFFQRHLLLIIIVSTVVICTTVVVVVFIRWKSFQSTQTGLQGWQNSSTNNRQNASHEIENYDEIQSSEEYDEIDSASYQSVAWRDYSLEDENETATQVGETNSNSECELKYLNGYDKVQEDAIDEIHRYDVYYCNVNQSND